MKKALFVAGALAIAAATSVSAQDYAKIFSNQEYSATPFAYAGRCQDQPYCVIEVEVTNPKDKLNCGRVSPNVVVLLYHDKSTYPVQILWRSITPDWEISKVSFKGSAPFRNPQKVSTGFRWDYTAKHPVKGANFPYLVSLTNPKTKQTCAIDPGLVTDW
jgi:hypothetical protein